MKKESLQRALQHIDPLRLLHNYHLLINKVDGWLVEIESALRPYIQCRPGCSGCCKNFTLSSVEAYSIAIYLKANGVNMVKVNGIDITDYKRRYGKHGYTPECKDSENTALSDSFGYSERTGEEEGNCIFLDKGLCTIYPVRPLICRTHGYPIVVQSDGEVRVDHCPRNFQHAVLKREYLIDLDHLNTMLFSINALFLKEFDVESSGNLRSKSHGMSLNGKRVSFHEIVMAL